MGSANSLLGFVTAAYLDVDFRAALWSQPSAALRRFGYEAGDGKSLRPPDKNVSLTIDDDTLFGPTHWRTWHASDPILATTEVRLLAAGAKPMVLVHGAEPALTAVGAWARTQGYAALLSPFQFEPEADAALGRYSNCASALAPAIAGSGQWRGLLLSPDTAVAELAWLCLLFGWDALLGKLLGYPNCCADAFARDWPRARTEFRGDPALMWLALHDRQDVALDLPWETNVYARYFGHELVQHFPCTPHCAATRSLARRNMSALQLYWPDAALALLSALQAPIMMHDEWTGLFPGCQVVPDPAGTRWRYDRALARILFADPAVGAALANGGDATLHNGSWTLAGCSWSVHALTFGRYDTFMEERQDAVFQPANP
jgi:hypothetical protein